MPSSRVIMATNNPELPTSEQPWGLLWNERTEMHLRSHSCIYSRRRLISYQLRARQCKNKQNINQVKLALGELSDPFNSWKYQHILGGRPRQPCSDSSHECACICCKRHLRNTNTKSPLICANQMTLNGRLLWSWAPAHAARPPSYQQPLQTRAKSWQRGRSSRGGVGDRNSRVVNNREKRTTV